MIAPSIIPRPDTLKGIDNLIRADFIAFRETCFNWLLAATGLVVAGLVFEGPELWHDISSIIQRWRSKRRFRSSLPEEHTPDWAKLLAFAGWLLIVVGVAGEYVADSFVSRADGYVQTFDEIVLTETQNRTALANERASAAYERASENERETADTLKQVEQERADAAKSLAAAETARKEAEDFQLQIAQANEHAAEAERETERLKARFADRVLNDKQAQSIAEKIKRFEGQEFDVTPYWDLPESFKIANRIAGILSSQLAGWKYVAPDKSGFMLGGTAGVQVWVHPAAPDIVKRAADALVSALNAENITTVLKTQNPQNPIESKIHINVGTKE